MDSGNTIETIKNLSNGHPKWKYAIPKYNSTLKIISGVTRSTKILVDSENNVIGRYKMGFWDVNQWIEILKKSI